MPKEAFGGDDSGGGGGGKKKPGLSRFGLSPDINIKDVFWKLMSSYADTGKPGMDLSTLENDRFSLMRSALSVLSGKQGEQHGFSAGAVAEYSVMMMVEGRWDDALRAFLVEGAEEHEARNAITPALRKLFAMDAFRGPIAEGCASLLRKQDTTSAALLYISGMESPDMAKRLRKELVIIARGGIGEDQMNAIKAITPIKGEDDVKRSFMVLLSHWDSQARLAAAEALKDMKDDNDVKAAAAKRLAVETDARIKGILSRIAG